MTYQQSPLVDAYLAHLPDAIQEQASLLREAIQAEFPTTTEDISYGVPTYRPSPGKRGIVHFAAAKDHIGIYAIFDPKDNPTIHELMKPYRTGRGTLQFKNSEPLPMETIRQILAYQASVSGI